jgi:nicotinate-nucleotide adenylyltransferase
VDTLRTLKTLYPKAELYLFVGADMFMTLGTWYCAEEILQTVTVCTVPRDDVSAAMLRKHGEALGGQWYVAEHAVGDISSTEIRARIATGQSLQGLVPDNVAAYIAQNRLYTEHNEDAQKQLELQLIEIIRKRESNYRVLHSLEVAKSAEELAKRYGADLHKARVAGLLHDVMKDVSGTEQLQILKDFGILLTDVEKHAPKLWHAIAGAAFVQHILGFEDTDIVNAIRYHTTARAGMSLLEKVIFIADFISEDRNYPGVEEMRKIAYESLDKAIVEGIAFTIGDLAKRRDPIVPETIDAYNDAVLAVRHGR